MSVSCNIMHLCYEDLNPKDTGLGNTLFQLATQYALSKKYSLQMNIQELIVYCQRLNKINYDHDKTIFRKLLNIFDSSYIQDYVLLQEERNKEQVCDTNIENKIVEEIEKSSDVNIKLYGYLQSHVYFDQYRNDILDLFEIDNRSFHYIKNIYPILFDDKYVCISLHVRMNYCGIDYNFNYFKQAIQYFIEEYSHTGLKPYFLVFSNNIDSIKDWFYGNNEQIPYLIVNNSVDYLDLWTMSLCKHNIISHSTFSWWGAYLNNNPEKKVLYPNDALRIFWGKLYDEPQNVERKTEHYKPEWIGLEVNTF